MPAHLEQQSLSDHDKGILAQLPEWLLKAKFAKREGVAFELCVDESLPEKWRLLGDLQLVQQIAHPGYSIIKVPGPTSSPFSAKSPFYLTPIRIAEGSTPAVDGFQLSSGLTTYVHRERKITIEPSLDILFIVTRDDDSSIEEGNT